MSSLIVTTARALDPRSALSPLFLSNHRNSLSLQQNAAEGNCTDDKSLETSLQAERSVKDTHLNLIQGLHGYLGVRLGKPDLG